MKNESLIQQINEIAKPFAEELGYEIYHIEYIKEGGEFYLRIYIDKDGGVALSDCEALSRRVNDVLDEVDPIKDPYFFEVSSPGLNRTLFTDNHMKRFIESEVLVKFTKTFEGKKNLKGILKNVNDQFISIEAEGLIEIPREKVKSVNIEGEI